MEKLNIHAIIQARIASTRLPAKVMLTLSGTSLIEHIVNRLSASTYLNKIIIATTTNIEDDIIENFAIEKGVPIYRGSSNNVLDRYFKCATTYKSDIIIRITADDPFKDVEIIDHAIEIIINNRFDYVSNTIDPSYPEGLDVEVFDYVTLKKIHSLATKKSDLEHVTSFLKNNRNLFKTHNFYSKINYKHIRLTIDRVEDYVLASKVYSKLFKNSKNYFKWNEIIDFLSENPALIVINSHISRDEGYKSSILGDLNE